MLDAAITLNDLMSFLAARMERSTVRCCARFWYHCAWIKMIAAQAWILVMRSITDSITIVVVEACGERRFDSYKPNQEIRQLDLHKISEHPGCRRVIGMAFKKCFLSSVSVVRLYFRPSDKDTQSSTPQGSIQSRRIIFQPCHPEY